LTTQTHNINANHFGMSFVGYNIMDPNAGFSINDKINVEVWVYMESFTGMGSRCKPQLDFSDPCSAHADLT
ncbi:hypothetical protein PMAYCL1PPCAC_25871, partial [Pristionchus mayeri]